MQFSSFWLSFHTLINTLRTISAISKKTCQISRHIFMQGGVASIFIENKQHGTIKGIFTAFGHSSHWRHKAPREGVRGDGEEVKGGRCEEQTQGGGKQEERRERGVDKKARASSSLISSPHQHAPLRASLAAWFAQKIKVLQSRICHFCCTHEVPSLICQGPGTITLTLTCWGILHWISSYWLVSCEGETYTLHRAESIAVPPKSHPKQTRDQQRWGDKKRQRRLIGEGKLMCGPRKEKG